MTPDTALFKNYPLNGVRFRDFFFLISLKIKEFRIVLVSEEPWYNSQEITE